MSHSARISSAQASQCLLGIEIGGSKLQLLVAQPHGEILARSRLQSDRDAAAIQNQIAGEIKRLGQEHRIHAVGVGFGGPVNWQAGTIAVSHQVSGWSGFPLAQWIARLAGAPATVDNDANVGALGEAAHGAGSDLRTVFYVTLGSGVGGGLVVNRQIYHGAHPGECEIGHLRLYRDGTTVESRCSGWSVDARIRALPPAEQGGELWRLARGMTRGEAHHLAAALAADDPAAARLLDETCADLAFALSHVVHLLHPEIIILGGGLSEIGEPLRRRVADRLPGAIMDVFKPGPTVALSSLREDAVPVGALELARKLLDPHSKVTL